MIRKCIKKSEHLNLNHNYVVLKTAKSMLKVIDNTMEGVWYDESFFEHIKQEHNEVSYMGKL